MQIDVLGKVICCFSLLVFYPSVAKELDSNQYDARLCSAQLLVIKGDLIRLQQDKTRELHKTGLKQRIAGALGTIGWLCRQNSDGMDFNDSTLSGNISSIRLDFQNKNWKGFEQKILTLIEKKPLDAKDFNIKNLSQKTLKTSISIYQHYCKACHQQAHQETEIPAYSLFDMAKTMSQAEFLARMLVGVHGTPKIALRNPLTDEDITGMLSYFRNTDYKIQN